MWPNLSKKGRYFVLAIISAVGALGGYLYWLKIGCSSGSCAITSNPYLSTLWGLAFGYLLADMILGKNRNTATGKEEAGKGN
ncbi:MAG: hypothetical protein Kow00127_08090 [Bacteroidales bacterium]